MKFYKPNSVSESKSAWLKVADVDDRDNFIIKDEIASGRSKYETEGTASGMIQRISDKKLFMKTFKPMELEKLTDAFGEDSKGWIGKEIEVIMLVSKKWNKPYLAINPVMNVEEPF